MTAIAPTFNDLKESAILAFDADISRYSRTFAATLPEGFDKMASVIRNDLLVLKSAADVVQFVANKRTSLTQDGISATARTVLSTAMEAFSSRISNKAVLGR